jgi:hypothetical protein
VTVPHRPSRRRQQNVDVPPPRAQALDPGQLKVRLGLDENDVLLLQEAAPAAAAYGAGCAALLTYGNFQVPVRLSSPPEISTGTDRSGGCVSARAGSEADSSSNSILTPVTRPV